MLCSHYHLTKLSIFRIRPQDLLHKPSPESSGINLIYPHRQSLYLFSDSIDTVAEELRAISIYLYTIPPVWRHSKVVCRLAIKLLCPQADWIHTAARSGKTNRDGGVRKRKKQVPAADRFFFVFFLEWNITARALTQWITGTKSGADCWRFSISPPPPSGRWWLTGCPSHHDWTKVQNNS